MIVPIVPAEMIVPVMPRQIMPAAMIVAVMPSEIVPAAMIVAVMPRQIMPAAMIILVVPAEVIILVVPAEMIVVIDAAMAGGVIGGFRTLPDAMIGVIGGAVAPGAFTTAATTLSERNGRAEAGRAPGLEKEGKSETEAEHGKAGNDRGHLLGSQSRVLEPEPQYHDRRLR